MGCEIARYKKNLMKEEEIYRKLLYIFRSPKLLIHMTRRKIIGKKQKQE